MKSRPTEAWRENLESDLKALGSAAILLPDGFLRPQDLKTVMAELPMMYVFVKAGSVEHQKVIQQSLNSTYSFNLIDLKVDPKSSGGWKITHLNGFDPYTPAAVLVVDDAGLAQMTRTATNQIKRDISENPNLIDSFYRPLLNEFRKSSAKSHSEGNAALIDFGASVLNETMAKPLSRLFPDSTGSQVDPSVSTSLIVDFARQMFRQVEPVVKPQMAPTKAQRHGFR